MTDVAKKSALFLVLAFAAYYLLTEPANAADAIKGAIGAVVTAFEALMEFLSELAS